MQLQSYIKLTMCVMVKALQPDKLMQNKMALLYSVCLHNFRLVYSVSYMVSLKCIWTCVGITGKAYQMCVSKKSHLGVVSEKPLTPFCAHIRPLSDLSNPTTLTFFLYESSSKLLSHVIHVTLNFNSLGIATAMKSAALLPFLGMPDTWYLQDSLPN